MPATLPNIALDLVRVTESAALASIQWDDKNFRNTSNDACIDAIRQSFRTIDV